MGGMIVGKHEVLVCKVCDKGRKLFYENNRTGEEMCVVCMERKGVKVGAVKNFRYLNIAKILKYQDLIDYVLENTDKEIETEPFDLKGLLESVTIGVKSFRITDYHDNIIRLEYEPNGKKVVFVLTNEEYKEFTDFAVGYINYKQGKGV